ncbi:MAG: ATP-binding protein [Halothece sp.]
MSDYDPTLEKLIKFIPHCQPPERLETILQLCQEYNSNFMVVVDEARHPLGLISALTAWRYQGDRPYSHSLLSPVTTVSEQSQLNALLGDLEQGSREEKILVVDDRGKLKGELDTETILQLLLREKALKTPSQEQISPLLDFLEKLPLPLMLETEKGKPIHQNAHWREKICSHGENCCLLSVDPKQESEKQWCNIISQGSRVQEEESKNCPLFPLSGTTAMQGKTSGVWQFITLNLPNTVFGSLFLVLATDISEQRQLCRELAAKNADLVQLNRLKDEFLACITHELKSPLTAIVGLSNLLNQNSIGELNERQQRYVNQVYQSGRQLMNLVNDLLDLARLETGQLQLHPEAVDLKTVCDRAYDQAQQQTPESQAQFTLHIESGLDTMVADELRLRQMLVHLLSNARKFTTEEGEIGLEVNQWDGWIAFKVWDTGIGIPEESQHLIFQKFQQLEDPMTRQFSGTGLGLVLTQRLAHAHGGDVSFISESGKGSQFTLLLPPTPAQKSLNAQTGSDRGVKKLVLVVEAVPRYVNNLTQKLRELGYRVAIARSGTEALVKARTFQPCTILLNSVLPLLSGWDVLTLLKSHPNSYHIPIILTATRGEKEQALSNGADAFLTLPVETNCLQDALLACAAPRSLYRKHLTVLRLHYSPTNTPLKPDPVTEMLNLPPQNLKNINYRILEADDPEQAELLQRIWHPDVLLLTGENIPQSFITEISEQDTLPHLPVVCLDTTTAQLAHQVGNLSVYPCLDLNPSYSSPTLWSVLQFAAGINPSPSSPIPQIVVVDGKKLNTAIANDSEWLKAFIQYLNTAGYRSFLSASWTEIYHQIQQEVTDLIFLDLEGVEPSSDMMERLKQLSQIKKLPIIALTSPQQLEQSPPLHDLLQEIATEIVLGRPQSMEKLLKSVEKQFTR